MTTFASRNRSRATVPAPRSSIWEVLSDPDALAELTPLVSKITVHGRTWDWQLSGISALGICVAPTFSEAMTLSGTPSG